MTRPAVTPVAERVYTALTPFAEQDEAYGWPLLRFVDALTTTAADVETFAADTDAAPGWSILLDPATSPARALPFLGQMVGVVVPAGTDAVTARALVNARGGWGRGTPAAIIAAARITLTGGRHVTLTERDGSPYRVRVTTYTAETPDATALHAAVNAALPAGLVAAFTLLVGWTYGDLEDRYDGQTWADFEADWAGKTWSDLEREVP